ncbi:hypothetical protein [Cryobacterium sp. SO1]|uniref:hypothetical protein n=1 Tax=Cryobacterium sp. SO1 TaxID=1897061 RepID=UPI001023BE4D|nr:hypothetical protein [Cryobacterium sp. SO1]RZI37397.1 hypothetical protein BJQ95_00227 [Cryobacterium sp. SO1]
MTVPAGGGEALLDRLCEGRPIGGTAGPFDAYVGDLNHMMGVKDLDYKSTISFNRPDVATTATQTVGAAGTTENHFASNVIDSCSAHCRFVGRHDECHVFTGGVHRGLVAREPCLHDAHFVG